MRSTFLRSLYKCGKNVGKQLRDNNNFVRNRVDASGSLFQEREVNLLLFITTRMFIFYAIGIHEGAR